MSYVSILVVRATTRNLCTIFSITMLIIGLNSIIVFLVFRDISEADVM